MGVHMNFETQLKRLKYLVLREVAILEKEGKLTNLKSPTNLFCMTYQLPKLNCFFPAAVLRLRSNLSQL